MKKMLAILLVLGLLMVTASVNAVPAEKFCVDSDNGIDIWTSGYTTDEKGVNYDDCDGASENLKEFRCDGDKTKLDNIKCTDYNAVCVTADLGDYCACEQGTVYDAQQNSCVSEENEVPEFGVVAAGVAMIGALGVFAFTRRKN